MRLSELRFWLVWGSRARGLMLCWGLRWPLARSPRSEGLTCLRRACEQQSLVVSEVVAVTVQGGAVESGL